MSPCHLVTLSPHGAGGFSPGVSPAAGSPVFGDSVAPGAGGGSETSPSPACWVLEARGGAGGAGGGGGMSGERAIGCSGVGKGTEGTGAGGLSVGASTMVSDADGRAGAWGPPAGTVSGPA